MRCHVMTLDDIKLRSITLGYVGLVQIQLGPFSVVSAAVDIPRTSPGFIATPKTGNFQRGYPQRGNELVLE